jgi:hypothetical protein
MDKAKQMVAGSYKDIITLKIKFTSSSIYGAILAFVNEVQYKILDTLVIVSNDYLIDNIVNNQDWKNFEKEISSASANITDFRLINEIKDKFERGFNTAVCNSVIKLIEKGDSIQLSHVMQKFVQDGMGLTRVDISIEYQKISSLEMELESQVTRKIDTRMAGSPSDAKPEPAKAESAVAEGDEPKPGSNGIKAIIRASLILSPIRGKHIAELKIGDRVLVSLVEMNDQTKSIAKAFNAYNQEEGRILPIPARVKSLRLVDGAGYKIYVVIAKGILGQIIEEEKNIKVALDPSVIVTGKDEKQSPGNTGLIMIVALVAVIIILVAAIILIAL